MHVANESSQAPSLRRLPFLVRLAPQFLNNVFAVLPANGHAPEPNEGLLFGLIETESAVVRVFRPFPAHVDTNRTAGSTTARQESFEALLRQSKTDPELAGLRVLGWFSARKFGGLRVEDVAFHQKNFPNLSDIVLILKREPAWELSLEIYCRCLDRTLSDKDHRWGTVRISSALPATFPTEVPMQVKAPKDVHAPTHQLGVAVEEDGGGSAWKDALASRTKKTFELLKTGKPGDNGGNTAGPDREKFESPTVDNHAPQLGTRGGAAPALARVSSETTETPEPIESNKKDAPSLDPEEPQIISSPQHAAVKSSDQPTVVRREEQRRPEVPAVSPLPASANVAGPNLPATPLSAGSDTPAAKLPQYVTAKPRGMPWLALGALFAITAGSTFGVIYLRSAHANGALPSFLQAVWPSPGLELKLASNGDRVQLSWNRNSPAIRKAKEAILEISDGAVRREIRLDAREVASGSVLYLPGTDNVVFRFEVHGEQGQNVTEIIRVLGGSKPANLDASSSRVSSEDTPDNESASASAKAIANRLRIGGKETVDAARLVPAKLRGERPQAQDLRAAHRPSDAASRSDFPLARPSANPDPSSGGRSSTVAAPVTEGALPRSGASNPALTNEVAESVPPTSAPQVAPIAGSSPSNVNTGSPATQFGTGEAGKPQESAGQTRPAQNVLTPSVPGQIPTTPQAQPQQTSSPDARPLITYRPPRPVKQVLPKLTDIPGGLADSPAEMRVIVKVNESGRVVDAQLIEGKKKVPSILRNAVLSAARQWLFDPAALRGKSIASEHTILFHFRH